GAAGAVGGGCTAVGGSCRGRGRAGGGRRGCPRRRGRGSSTGGRRVLAHARAPGAVGLTRAPSDALVGGAFERGIGRAGPRRPVLFRRTAHELGQDQAGQGGERGDRKRATFHGGQYAKSSATVPLRMTWQKVVLYQQVTVAGRHAHAAGVARCVMEQHAV